MKKIFNFFPIVLCFLLSLAAVIHFWNHPERWRVKYALIGLSFFFIMLVALLLVTTMKKKKP